MTLNQVSLPYRAFKDCPNLKFKLLNLPELTYFRGTTGSDSSVFSGSGISSVYCPKCQSVGSNVFLDCNGNNRISCVFESLTNISAQAFKYTGGSYFDLQKNVQVPVTEADFCRKDKDKGIFVVPPPSSESFPTYGEYCVAPNWKKLRGEMTYKLNAQLSAGITASSNLVFEPTAKAFNEIFYRTTTVSAVFDGTEWLIDGHSSSEGYGTVSFEIEYEPKENDAFSVTYDYSDSRIIHNQTGPTEEDESDTPYLYMATTDGTVHRVETTNLRGGGDGGGGAVRSYQHRNPD